MALSHFSKLYGSRECRIAKLTGDLAVANTAPTAPGAPTLSVGTAGVLTYTYYAVAYTAGSADSVAGATVTTSLAASGSANTLTFAAAVPAGQTFKVIRSVAPAGITTGVIGYAAAAATTFLDSNLPAVAYVPNTSGTTYGLTIPVPGIKAVKVSGTVNTVDLRGDNTFLDSDSMLASVEVEIDYAKLSLDVMNVMMGGTVIDAGVTPNQTATWSLLNPPSFGYFKLEVRTVSADPAAGDFHILFNKVKLAAMPQVGTAEENYQLFALKCKAVPPLSGTPWLTLVENETAVACAA